MHLPSAAVGAIVGACGAATLIYLLGAGRRSARQLPPKCAPFNDKMTGDVDDDEAGAIVAQQPQLPAATKPELVVMVRHVSKRANMGAIVRVAGAFDATELALVGRRKQDVHLFGAHGADTRVAIRAFYHAYHATGYLRRDEVVTSPPHERDVMIVGLEIMPGAVSVASYEFARRVRKAKRVVFLPGNEGAGLTDSDKELCDWFCYIPQVGQATASMNVVTAVAVALHRFAEAVGAREAPRAGEKFVVAAGPDAPVDDDYSRQVRQTREWTRADKKEQPIDLEGLFDDDDEGGTTCANNRHGDAAATAAVAEDDCAED
jgi:tRNA G18 (ribose-2'-O)-methylase SpoU